MVSCYLCMYIIFWKVTKPWIQPNPHSPACYSKKIELVRGINISWRWVRTKQGCRGDSRSSQLKCGLDIRGQEIGLDMESSWWGCWLRRSCHLEKTREAVSAEFVSKQSAYNGHKPPLITHPLLFPNPFKNIPMGRWRKLQILLEQQAWLDDYWSEVVLVPRSKSQKVEFNPAAGRLRWKYQHIL